MADYEVDGGPRYPCSVCGRKFFQESLGKHENVCAKNAAKKRRVFDSSKQRADGTDITVRQIKQAQKKEVAPPKSNWRAQHQEFISTVRAARGVSKAIAEGGPLPPPPPPSLNPDYIQCPYCSRRFNKQAADRHINFCKEQSQRINSRPPPNATAKAKQATRLQYQAPKPKARTAPSDSPQGSGVGARNPPPARGPPGAGARPGMGGPSSRGRAGSYQGLSVPDARGRQHQNHSRNAATTSAGAVHDHNILRTTTTLSSTSPSSPHSNHNSHAQPTTDGPAARQTRAFPHNRHPKLSSIRDRGDHSGGYDLDHDLYHFSGETEAVGRHANGAGPLESLVRDGGRREPSLEEDFCLSARDAVTPEYDQHRYASPRDLHHGHRDFHQQPLPKARIGSGKRVNGRGGLSSTASMSRFCHECGSSYPVTTAKFCCECGTRRLRMA